jgi:predicted kinase
MNVIKFLLLKAPDFVLCFIARCKIACFSLKEKEVCASYLDSLNLAAKPITEDALQTVLCMVGLPQSGKTLVAQALAKKFGFIVISNNEIRHLYYAARINYGNENFVALSVLDKILASGHSVIIDSDCSDQLKRDFIWAVAYKYDVRMEYQPIVTSIESVCARQSSGDSEYFFDSVYHLEICRSKGYIGHVTHEQLCALVKQEFLRQEPGWRKILEASPGLQARAAYNGILNNQFTLSKEDLCKEMIYREQWRRAGDKALDEIFKEKERALAS